MRLASLLIGLALLAGAIGYAVAQSLKNEGEVRIVAQRLEDGRVEFGLEQDGERILPERRYFPADASVGRWLRSSPVSIESPPPSVAIREQPLGNSISGSGDDYRSAGYFAAGNYICTASVSGNVHRSDRGAHFSVVSYGYDGSYGGLHANEIAASYWGWSRLSVGSVWSADVPVGEVFFDVTAVGRWSIDCK